MWRTPPHELRTPLTTIRMVIEALESDDSVTASETNRSFLSMAETESTRMEMLIKNLLTLSQLDSQTMQFHARPFNITESVEYIAGTCLPSMHPPRDIRWFLRERMRR